jgi:hypothetical protein
LYQEDPAHGESLGRPRGIAQACRMRWLSLRARVSDRRVRKLRIPNRSEGPLHARVFAV